jgi:DNA-binding MarR family transcriptional regulator
MKSSSSQTHKNQPAFDYQSAPGFLIRRLQQNAVAAFQARTGEWDLSPLQFAALNALVLVPDCDQASLAELICLDAATTGAVLARLEQKSFIARSPDPTDKRRKRLAITAEGSNTLREMTSAVAAAQDDMLGPLSPSERSQFLSLITKLTQSAT